MTVYKCDLCVFTTERYHNYKVHLISNKHIRNIELNKNNIKLKKKSNKNISFRCKYCNKPFTDKSNLYRHQKHYCNDNKNYENDNDNIIQYIKSLEDKINKMGQQICQQPIVPFISPQIEQFMDYQINKQIGKIGKQNEKPILEDKIDELIDIIKINAETINTTAEALNTTAETAKNSISMLKYASKNFKDAPPIYLLNKKDITKLIAYDKKNKNNKIEDYIVSAYKTKTIYSFMGDLIISSYKKVNPKDQSIISTDVSRLTFIIKQLIAGTNQSEWVTDSKGVKITTLIITPLLDKIREMMINFINENHDIMSDTSELDDNEMDKLLDRMKYANSIIYDINQKYLHDEILKYIAPRFKINIVDL